VSQSVLLCGASNYPGSEAQSRISESNVRLVRRLSPSASLTSKAYLHGTLIIFIRSFRLQARARGVDGLSISILSTLSRLAHFVSRNAEEVAFILAFPKMRPSPPIGDTPTNRAESGDDIKGY
jgi:hypothetical protein